MVGRPIGLPPKKRASDGDLLNPIVFHNEWC